MKYVVYPALAFVAALLFLPSHYSNGIRNLPLLIFIISCISLYYTVSAAKRVITLFKIRKRLIGEHMSIKRFSLVPNIFGIKEKYDIVAESRHSTVNIVLLMCRRSNLRYHFERPDLLEYYKGSKNSLRATRHGAAKVSIAQTSGQDTTTLVKKKKLPFPTSAQKGTVNVIVMDRFPRAVTDSVSRQELGNGDSICGTVKLFSLTSQQ